MRDWSGLENREIVETLLLDRKTGAWATPSEISCLIIVLYTLEKRLESSGSRIQNLYRKRLQIVLCVEIRQTI